MKTDDENYRTLNSVISLDNGYSLGWTTGAEGDAWPVIVSPSVSDEPSFIPYAPRHFTDIAPHENAGKLRGRYRVNICGATNYKGNPCRNHRGSCPRHEPAPLASQEQSPSDEQDQLW